MRKLLLVLCALFFVGCDSGFVPVAVSTNYTQATVTVPTDTDDSGDSTETEETVPKSLAAIDEDIVYLWEYENNRAYYTTDLPENNGDINPHPFLYEDGTTADVVDFVYYTTDHHFYIKVRESQAVTEEGITTGYETVYRIFKQRNGVIEECITTGYETVYRIFKQRNGVIEECASDTVFPAYVDDPLTECVLGTTYLEINKFGDNYFLDSRNVGPALGSCTYPCTQVTYAWQVGTATWFIGTPFDSPIPHAYRFYAPIMIATHYMDYVRVTYKH